MIVHSFVGKKYLRLLSLICHRSCMSNINNIIHSSRYNLNSVIRRFQENTLKHYLKWEWHFEFKNFSLVVRSFGGAIFFVAVHNVGH